MTVKRRVSVGGERIAGARVKAGTIDTLAGWNRADHFAGSLLAPGASRREFVSRSRISKLFGTGKGLSGEIWMPLGRWISGAIRMRATLFGASMR
jgi:hypothetical protein